MHIRMTGILVRWQIFYGHLFKNFHLQLLFSRKMRMAVPNAHVIKEKKHFQSDQKGNKWISASLANWKGTNVSHCVLRKMRKRFTHEGSNKEGEMTTAKCRSASGAEARASSVEVRRSIGGNRTHTCIRRSNGLAAS